MSTEVRHRDSNRDEAGFTLLEMMTVLALFGVVFSGMFFMIDGAVAAFETGNTVSELQEQGRRMLKRVMEELQTTGIVTAAEVGSTTNYPAVYERDPALSPFLRGRLIATLDPNDQNIDGYDGTGTHPDRRFRNQNRISDELVFRRTVDRDGNGFPTDATTGLTEWSTDEISFLVEPGPHGNLRFVRYINDSFAEVLGHHVTKVTFDTIRNDPLYVRYNQIAIVLYLERTNRIGQHLSVAIEGTVNLRNTRPLP